MESPARPYRSHRIPACDFCRRRKSRCDRERLDEPCSLCRLHGRQCTTARTSGTGTPSRATGPTRATRTPTRVDAAPTRPPRGQVVCDGSLSNDPPSRAPSRTPAAENDHPTVSAHIVGPALARDAQVLQQYGTTTATAVSHVHPNPYSVYSDDPRSPVVYMKVPRQRTRVTSGNGTPGFKQFEVMDKVVEPAGRDLVELYFSVVHPPFPVLDKAAVLAAYREGTLPHALACEIYAVALVFWPQSPTLVASGRPPPDVRYIWTLAVSALHEDFLSPGFSTVVACILDLLGRPITSITYNAVNVGSAVALAQSLGLNRNPARWQQLAPAQKRLRVRTWWALLVHDAWASLCHGTPGHIHRDQWDVELADNMLDPESVDTPGAQTFVALCRLTQILADVLAVVYCLRVPPLPLEQTLRTIRRCETAVDDWQGGLPRWLAVVVGGDDDGGDAAAAAAARRQPGALNLALSVLAVRLCLCRVALQTTRTTDPDEARYHQSRCVKAGTALIDFVVGLTVEETGAFWLPYTAYHFASAATLMLRCALEASSETVGRRCVASARRLVDFLRRMKTDADWDLADICLGQCETTVRQMSDGGYAAFRRRNEPERSGERSEGENETPHSERPQTERSYDGAVPTWFPEDNASLFWDPSLDEMPENVYFPELWQVNHADFRWR